MLFLKGGAPHGVVLHSDLNCFYASVEMNEHPELRGQKVAVCGSTENRHGIVLTASYPAKRSGVKTGMANWEACQACPGLICVPPHYDLYLKYSRLVREIYHRYASDVEPFGMDECWIDIPWTDRVDTDGVAVANEIRCLIAKETGITASVGVSFSKVFAKLGSDMKKPDAVTAISRDHYRAVVWPLPVSELLYVGRATAKKLALLGICTIGELALSDPELLRKKLGVNGVMLWRFARGEDRSPVLPARVVPPIRSVGHGVTCTRDLQCQEEVWPVLLFLAQDLGHRLRFNGLSAAGVRISVKDRDLHTQQYQSVLRQPTMNSLELALLAFDQFRARYSWEKPVRALTVSAISLRDASLPVQTDLFSEYEKREKMRRAEDVADDLRRRYGERIILPASICRGTLPTASDRCETVEMPDRMYM